ncbi:hypothetical protein F4774DRAFT_425415 [Daldinia eschscholtzii]|nr:hypothetical protein F4774DRAFT_425415 [Daldinia eschscholtzii]
MGAEDEDSLTRIMEGLDYDKIYIEAWRSTIARCEKNLERCDLKDALQIKSAGHFRRNIDRMLRKYKNELMGIEVLMLLIPILHHYEQFANSFVHLMDNEVEVSMMWGLLHLVLKLALESTEDLDRINRMVKSIGCKLEYMNETMSNFDNKGQKKKVYMDISTDLVNLWLNIILAFRDITLGGPKSLKWEEIMSRFKDVLSLVEEATGNFSRILARNAKEFRIEEFERLQALLQPETVTPTDSQLVFPCHMLPSHQNHRFFSRSKELDMINESLQPKASQKIMTSVAVHGLGGVGKTQIALTYAYQHRQDYDAIFWFHAQTITGLEQCVNEATKLLGIKESNPDAHNLVIFHDWLQSTDRTWLLIFDNAENEDWINSYWPHAVLDRGSILITSRKPSFGIYLARTSLPIEPFNPQDGPDFIFHLLHNRNPSTKEKSAACKLSNLVGGHALALTQASSLIYKRRWSIDKYLEMHTRHPQRLRDAHTVEWMHAGYPEGVKTVFLMSFQTLSDSASAMLSILALLAPDAIPESIFINESTILPLRLQFCSDEFEVSEVVEELAELTLVNRDSETNKLSVHRLVQSERRFYSGVDVQTAFDDASLLLFHAFPQQVHGRTFEPQFPQCDMLIQHLFSLRDILNNSLALNSKLQPSVMFCRVMCNAAYYLVEKGATKELEKTISVAMNAFRSSNLIEADPLAYAHLCNSAALEREMNGDFNSSKKLLEISKDIRCRELPPGHEDIWVVMNNLGNLSLSMGQPDEALKYHLICKDTVNPNVIRNVAINFTNIARAYTALGRFSDALEYLKKTKALRPSTEMSFRSYYYWAGNLYLAQENLDEAATMYRKGQEALTACGETLSPNMATCLYKLGVILLRQYQIQRDQAYLSDATKTFREAETIMELGKVADCEIARAGYMLSVALSIQNIDQKEAQEWREKSEAIRRKLQGERYDADAHSESTYDMLVESWVR